MTENEVFDAYIKRIPEKLSPVKKRILRTLWDAGTEFPRPWVTSSDLLRITGQKYFDRRIRELRDNTGCEIETGRFRGEAAYRLRSIKLLPPNPRLYLTPTQKKRLFEEAKYTCQICGKHIPPGTRGLQADHKVPLSRGGRHGAHNWQAICNECNVAKRRACEGCKDDCTVCPWAFPEKFGHITLVRFPSTMIQEMQQRGARTTKEIEDLTIRAVKLYLRC